MTLNPAFPGYNLESCFVHTHNIFAIWWNKSLDNQNFTKKAAEDMGTELEKMRENLNKNYSLKVSKLDCNSIKFLFPFQDPPNPSYGSFFNVYLFHESDKGAGMFTEYYQGDGSKPMPFIVLDDHYLVK